MSNASSAIAETHGGPESITVNMFIKFVRMNFEFKILASSKSTVSRERF